MPHAMGVSCHTVWVAATCYGRPCHTSCHTVCLRALVPFFFLRPRWLRYRVLGRDPPPCLYFSWVGRAQSASSRPASIHKQWVDHRCRAPLPRAVQFLLSVVAVICY